MLFQRQTTQSRESQQIQQTPTLSLVPNFLKNKFRPATPNPQLLLAFQISSTKQFGRSMLQFRIVSWLHSFTSEGPDLSWIFAPALAPSCLQERRPLPNFLVLFVDTTIRRYFNMQPPSDCGSAPTCQRLHFSNVSTTRALHESCNDSFSTPATRMDREYLLDASLPPTPNSSALSAMVDSCDVHSTLHAPNFGLCLWACSFTSDGPALSRILAPVCSLLLASGGLLAGVS